MPTATSFTNSPKTKPDPCVILIFGASGDLTSRKLIPALYEMAQTGALSADTCILGFSRSKLSDDAFRDDLKSRVKEFARSFDEQSWSEFAKRIYYYGGDATAAVDFEKIKKRIRELSEQYHCHGNILFYLAVKPSLFDPIIDRIDEAGFITEGRRWCSVDRDNIPWQRVVVEKPFGHDLQSAEHLNRVLGRVFEEEATFRIDHYLGKELVQNLLVFRFANSIFEPIWNHHHVDHVQITAAESVGIGKRAGYYDESGAVRDMIQSHLMQVLALVAMEPPSEYNALHIRAQKIQALDAIEPIEKSEIGQCAVFGQYAAGDDHPAYHELDGVTMETPTETFAAAKFHFDNWRWAGTPFYLRTGKRLAKKRTEVVVQFKRPAANLFRNLEPFASGSRRPRNRIVMEIAPNPGLTVRIEGKVPGAGVKIDSMRMHFDYVERFKQKPAESYGPLLLDVMRGDQTLFPHRLEVEAMWRAVMPLIGPESAGIREGIAANYRPGSWGPDEVDELLAQAGRKWHNPD